MNPMIFCQKLQQEAEALGYQPYPGEIGQRILSHISAQAWQMWLDHQTMLINEYRLNPMDPKAKELIVGEMEKFLFGEGSEKPADYVPEGDPNDPMNQEY